MQQTTLCSCQSSCIFSIVWEHTDLCWGYGLSGHLVKLFNFVQHSCCTPRDIYRRQSPIWQLSIVVRALPNKWKSYLQIHQTFSTYLVWRVVKALEVFHYMCCFILNFSVCHLAIATANGLSKPSKKYISVKYVSWPFSLLKWINNLTQMPPLTWYGETTQTTPK